MISYKNSQLFLFLAFLLTVSACSNINKFPPSVKNHSASNSNHTAKVTALNLASLQSLDAILPQLEKHKAVLVGESHTSYADHLNQLAIIKGLHKEWGKMAIGLEMIQKPFQASLDDYISGQISELEMLRGTQWYDRWRYDFRLYRPIFTYAKQHKIPLIALNVPKEITKRITKVGIDGLNKKERAQLPKTLDKSNSAYAKRLKDVFGKHSHTSSKQFDYFLEAQLAWDEGMAQTAANFLQNHLDYRMVILAGGGHVINREGIPDRLERRIQSKPAVVLNNIHGSPNAKQGDYLLFSSEVTLPPIGRLGISMNNASGGVIINAVLPHSAGAKAGLKKNDIILKLDTMTIKTTTDIRLWALDKKPGDAVVAVIKRKHNRQTVSIILGKSTPLLLK